MMQGFAMLATTFEPPTTKDFVFGCWGGSFGLFGFNFCFNFITFLLLLTSVIFVLLFYLAFWRATIVPGKFQSLMEMGIQFVREQIALPLLGEHADHYLPLLASLFFFIFIGNLFEVLPGFGLSASSRIAFPGVMAV